MYTMAITEIEDRISDIITQDNHDQFIYDFLSVYDFPKATITKWSPVNKIDNLNRDFFVLCHD